MEPLIKDPLRRGQLSTILDVFPIDLNLQEEDNLSMENKMAGPKVLEDNNISSAMHYLEGYFILC